MRNAIRATNRFTHMAGVAGVATCPGCAGAWWRRRALGNVSFDPPDYAVGSVVRTTQGFTVCAGVARITHAALHADVQPPRMMAGAQQAEQQDQKAHP